MKWRIKTVKKANETKSLLFENISKTDKPSPKWTKEEREKTELTRVGNGSRNIKIHRIKGISRVLWATVHKLDNLVEMDKFVERQNLPISLRKK